MNPLATPITPYHPSSQVPIAAASTHPLIEFRSEHQVRLRPIHTAHSGEMVAVLSNPSYSFLLLITLRTLRAYSVPTRAYNPPHSVIRRNRNPSLRLAPTPVRPLVTQPRHEFQRPFPTPRTWRQALSIGGAPPTWFRQRPDISPQAVDLPVRAGHFQPVTCSMDERLDPPRFRQAAIAIWRKPPTRQLGRHSRRSISLANHQPTLRSRSASINILADSNVPAASSFERRCGEPLLKYGSWGIAQIARDRRAGLLQTPNDTMSLGRDCANNNSKLSRFTGREDSISSSPLDSRVSARASPMGQRPNHFLVLLRSRRWPVVIP